MKNILAKVHAIMSEISYIQKDKKNSFHGYSYASEAVIKEKLHEAFIKHGIVLTFSVNDIRLDPIGEKFETAATVKCTWRMTDIETNEYIEGNAVGVGADKGDKGVYKAITGALKYTLTSNFLIPTGDDAENDDVNKAIVGKQNVREKVAKAEWSENASSKNASSKNASSESKSDINACPKCEVGLIVEKTGKYGTFLSCNMYPKCNYTPPKDFADTVDKIIEMLEGKSEDAIKKVIERMKADGKWSEEDMKKVEQFILHK